MKTTIYDIPIEILPAIFQNLTAQDLTKCRLACQAWNSVAYEIMLAKTKCLTNTTFNLKFHRFLEIRPEAAKHIKSLHLVNLMSELGTFEKLLKQAFTPSICKLTGKISQRTTKFLLAIAKNSAQKFSKLQCLPEPTRNNESFIEMQLYFKESLQRLRVSNNDALFTGVINRLNEFRHLVVLELKYIDLPDNLVELDRILSKCDTLQTLELELVSGDDEHTMGANELQKWCSRQVKRIRSVRTVEVSDVEGPHAIEYLVYKYPEASGIYIKHFVETVPGFALRIIDAIKDISYIELFSWCMGDIEGFKTLIAMTKSQQNQVQIKRNSLTLEESRLKFNIIRNRQRETTIFEIELRDNEPQAFYEDIISSIRSVSCLTIDYLGIREENYGDGSSFFDLLKTIPNIETLTFSDTRIKCSSMVDSLVLSNLKSLTICGAIIHQDVIRGLSKIAPNLKHVILDTCVLDENNPQSHRISLPETNLDSLVLTTRSIWMQYDAPLRDKLRKMEQDIEVGENKLVKLQLTTHRFNEYCILKTENPSSDNLVEFSGNITIECRSLGRLSVSLGALTTQVTFDREAEMEKNINSRLSRLLLENASQV